MEQKLFYVLFNAYPSSEPPFSVELGISGKKFIIENCLHIPDAVEKIIQYCKDNQLEINVNTTFLYPIYLEIMDTDYENSMHQIAWLIKDEADKNKLKFDRIGGYTNKTKEDFLN